MRAVALVGRGCPSRVRAAGHFSRRGVAYLSRSGPQRGRLLLRPLIGPSMLLPAIVGMYALRGALKLTTNRSFWKLPKTVRPPSWERRH